MVHFKGIPGGIFAAFVILSSVVHASFPYYGTKIGPLSQLHHQVSGDVYAVDSRTIFIKNFNYDGGAPAAYFYVGNSNKPNNGDGAWRVRDEKGSSSELTRRYRNKDITLSLPDSKTLRDIKWFSVWCDEYSVDFGSIKIPANLDFPRPQKISNLRGVHSVSSDDIVIVDAQTLLIPNFSYDGEAPDAKFWVGRGGNPTAQGLRIPDENGKQEPLRRYDRKTIVLTLPGDLTIFDIGHFGIWCEAFTVDFGHVRIPEGLNVPPSLKMLGVSPQSKLNCEVLYDDLAFEVRWAVAGESIVIQLVAKLENNEYMAFGVSPQHDKTVMEGADAAVAWVDHATGKGFAVDYHLNAIAQCSGKKGSCPDDNIRLNTNSVRLLNAAMVNGYSIVTYQRTLKAMDELDLPMFTNKSQAIVWAIGPLNERKETSFHSKYTKGNQFIDFGRQSKWNCPIPDGDKVIDDRDDDEADSEEYYDNREQALALHQEKIPETTTTTRKPIATPKPVPKDDRAWVIPPIECWEPDDGVFYAQMGPTGGKHGYSAITGHVGWGISWFINGLLIPEIHVVRGKTYTFVTEGGDDPSIPAKYHPFYITNDPVGGYEHKTAEERKNVTIYAGVHRSRTGKLTPTGIGRLCNWTPNQDGPDADTYSSFGEYQRTLTLQCEQGEPGFISWTPDEKTPDTVYYHCFTHRYLGWKIHVHDFCENGQASEVDVVYAEPPDDIIAEPSIQREIRIRPNDNFLEKHKTNLIKNHNMNIGAYRYKEQNRSNELTELLHEGIRAVEALEDKIAKGKSPPTEAPMMRATRPEMLQGEISISSKNASKLNAPNYMRPPYGMPLFRPKVTAAIMDRRPNNRPRRPGMVAQPSIIMPHYRKPMPVIMRPHLPMKEPNNYLMLGQHSIEPVLKPKVKHGGQISIPYSGDLKPQDSMVTYVAMKNMHQLKTKKPLLKLPIMHDKPNVPVSGFKKPYEVKELKETSLVEAVNEGFKPNTVVVESGFKPIIRDVMDGNSTINQDANRRNDIKKDPAEEINKAMEADTLFLSNGGQKLKQSFEPMFIPSPLDRINTSGVDSLEPIEKKPEAHEIVKEFKKEMMEREIPVVEQPDEGDELETEDDEDEIAVAAERVDTYYLPPYNAKRPPHRIPEGAVVTYDGKAVLDTTLITPPKIEFKDHLQDVRKGLSSIEEYVLRTPQFGPFRGEIPPLTPNFLPTDIPKNPVTEYSNPFITTPTGSEASSSPPKTISTKLSLIKSNV